MELKSLETIFAALNQAEVRYLVVGGLAVVAHGYVRLTMDIDLVIQLEDQNLARAMSVFRELGYRPQAPVALEDFAIEENRTKWVQEKGMVVFALISEQFATEPVDVFGREPFDFNVEYKSATRHEIASGVVIPIVTLPALLKMKIAAGRPKDQVDLLYLTKLEQESLD